MTLHVSAGWPVLPAALRPLRVQWEQPAAAVGVSVRSHRLDLWSVVTVVNQLFECMWEKIRYEDRKEFYG